MSRKTSTRPYNNPYPLKRGNKKREDQMVKDMREIEVLTTNLRYKYYSTKVSEETHKKLVKMSCEISGNIADVVWF